MRNEELAIIVEKVKNDKENNFENLFSTIWDTVFYLSLSMLGNIPDAEDVTQEILIKIYESIERTVGQLQAELDLDSSGTSQHLAALRQQGILDSRRAGTSVYYRIRDPRVSQLLAVARQILTSALSDSHALLSDLAEPPAEATGTPASPRRR